MPNVTLGIKNISDIKGLDIMQFTHIFNKMPKIKKENVKLKKKKIKVKMSC